MTNFETEVVPPQISPDTPLNPESLPNLQTLEIAVNGNLVEISNRLNTTLGVAMEPRSSDYHLTIISPPESGVLKDLTAAQIQELQEINDEIQQGIGISVAGIGYIDGADHEGIRPADKEKKTSFLAIDAPRINEFRQSIGLAPKDLHVTLGFENGDIHMQLTGEKDEKGKDKQRLIPKKADPRFDEYVPQDITFGKVTGQPRQVKQ